MSDNTTTVGVLGAGQLGRMLALAGYPLGLRFLLLDPAADAPASQVAEQIVADYGNEAALQRLAQTSVVTYEFESVPTLAAERLLELGALVLPHPRALAIAQDRLLEKRCFRALSIPTAEFHPVGSEDELRHAVAALGLPAVLKTRRLGYDGKGQVVLREPSDLDGAYARIGKVPAILERFVEFTRELSTLAVRGKDGRIQYYPLVQNQHRDGILRISSCPAPSSSGTPQREAERYASALLEHLDYIGVLALELFEVDGRLFANEFAPRVHNSGHFSIEASETSQFANHLRAILGLPLGRTELVAPAAMINLIGGHPAPELLLREPDVRLHLYGKALRRGRKIGHLTLTAASEAALAQRVAALRELIEPTQDG